MRCIPKYNVIYRGEFYPAGSKIEIREEDRDEMSAHGTIEESILSFDLDEPKRRVGRPRKAE